MRHPEAPPACPVNRLALACLLAVLAATAAVAQPTPVGTEFQVNTTTTNSQSQPDVASTPDGKLVVVWESYDGSGSGIFGQRFDSPGTPAGGEFQINTYTTGSQSGPRVATSGSGDFVVVWDEVGFGTRPDIFARRYDSAGNPLGGEFQVNTFTEGFGSAPAVAADADGDFVIAWSKSIPFLGFDIEARRFDSAGNALGSEFLVNSYTTGTQFRAAVGMDAAGGFVVVWNGGGSGSLPGLFAQRFDSGGTAVGGELQLDTNGADPEIDVTPGGDFVVAWDEYVPGAGGEIFARRFDAAASPQGAAFQVNSYTTGDQRSPDVAIDAAGNIAVTWEEGGGFGPPGQDGSGSGVLARTFDASGNALGDDFLVNTYTTGNQLSARVAMDADGEFVVAWASYGQDGSGGGIFALGADGGFPPQDSDGDGIPDDEDDCPDSDLSETVVIDGCDSGVTNYLFDNGCTITDLVNACADDASNHGQFTSCVAHLTNELKRGGIISGREKGAIQRCAAAADLP